MTALVAILLRRRGGRPPQSAGTVAFAVGGVAFAVGPAAFLVVRS